MQPLPLPAPRVPPRSALIWARDILKFTRGKTSSAWDLVTASSWQQNLSFVNTTTAIRVTRKLTSAPLAGVVARSLPKPPICSPLRAANDAQYRHRIVNWKGQQSASTCSHISMGVCASLACDCVPNYLTPCRPSSKLNSSPWRCQTANFSYRILSSRQPPTMNPSRRCGRRSGRSPYAPSIEEARGHS